MNLKGFIVFTLIAILAILLIIISARSTQTYPEEIFDAPSGVPVIPFDCPAGEACKG